MSQTAVLTSPSSTRVGRPGDPNVMVIFGAAGDLTRRKLIPALYNLASEQLLSREFAIIGVARAPMTNEQFRDRMSQDIHQFATGSVDSELWEWFSRRMYYVQGDFKDPNAYARLQDTLEKVDKEHNTHSNFFFYLATAPEYFGVIVEQLGKRRLFAEENNHWRRVIVEKPFGHDLESAKALNARIRKVVEERQIYRIDHYLGKETVQNILVFRFANGIFEPIWNRRYIDHVQITVAEVVGVERRGPYYDQTGALRDMIPNHLVQLLALTAMEPPASFSATALQNEQVKVLESVPPINPEECSSCVVRAQYTRGSLGEVVVAGYREEPLVDRDSETETYVALKTMVDNWRWAGVPFYLRTGKRLRRRNTEIAIQFRNPPLALFRRSGSSLPQPNRLVIGIQPQENMRLEFECKVPGPLIETTEVDMHFDYGEYFGVETRTGYETLLYDAMIGDASLFKRADMIEGGWAIIQPILNAWESGRGGDLYEYSAGTDGPNAADELMLRGHRRWRPI